MILLAYIVFHEWEKKVIDLDFGKMYGTQTYRSINRPK